jgi:hypothetical protein
MACAGDCQLFLQYVNYFRSFSTPNCIWRVVREAPCHPLHKMLAGILAAARIRTGSRYRSVLAHRAFCSRYQSVQAGTGPVSDGFMHCAASGGADRYRKPVPVCTGSPSLLQPVPVGTGRYRPSTGGFMPSAGRGFSAAVRAGTGRPAPACTTPELFGRGTDPYQPVQARYRRYWRLLAFLYLPTIIYDDASWILHDHICSYKCRP